MSSFIKLIFNWSLPRSCDFATYILFIWVSIIYCWMSQDLTLYSQYIYILLPCHEDLVSLLWGHCVSPPPYQLFRNLGVMKFGHYAALFPLYASFPFLSVPNTALYIIIMSTLHHENTWRWGPHFTWWKHTEMRSSLYLTKKTQNGSLLFLFFKIKTF